MRSAVSEVFDTFHIALIFLGERATTSIDEGPLDEILLSLPE